METTNIIVAVIAFLGTLLGSYYANNKTTAVMQERINSLKEDIGTLSERVNGHNQFDRRLAKIEAVVERMNIKI